MRPRARLEHDGREVHVLNRLLRGRAFVGEFPQCRTHEDAHTLVGVRMIRCIDGCADYP
jgi:hypothetical protein